MQTSWVDLLHWTLSCLLLSPESEVDCPCPWFHANSLCSTPTALVRVPRQLPLSRVPRQLLSAPLCPANSHSRPLPTSGYGEISGPRILCLVSRQNRQRNRLLWQPTHIVLHLPNSGFCRPGWPEDKTERNRNERLLLRHCQRTENTIEHESDGDTNCNLYARYSHKKYW